MKRNNPAIKLLMEFQEKKTEGKNGKKLSEKYFIPGIRTASTSQQEHCKLVINGTMSSQF